MYILKNILILFCITLFISSCSLFSPVKITENNYRLTSIPTVPLKKKHAIVLVVTQPDTSPLYDSKQIVYSIRPYQISYFANSQWAELPTKMIQKLIIQSLQNTRYFHAVITPSSLGQYDYVLWTQLLELHQDFTQCPSVVRVVLKAELTQRSTNRIIAVKQFSVVRTAPENTACGGVIAANSAVADLLYQLTLFVLKTLS